MYLEFWILLFDGNIITLKSEILFYKKKSEFINSAGVLKNWKKKCINYEEWN